MRARRWAVSFAALACRVSGERRHALDETTVETRTSNLRHNTLLAAATAHVEDSPIQLVGGHDRNLRSTGGEGVTRKSYYGKEKDSTAKRALTYHNGKGKAKAHYKPRGKDKRRKYGRPSWKRPQESRPSNIFHRPLEYLFGKSPTPILPPTPPEEESNAPPTEAPPPDSQNSSTVVPSPSPTCKQKDLDVCIVIDRSGSICTEADEPFISCKDNPDCGCDNWDSVRKFTSGFVQDVGAFSETQAFALVGYATTARVVSSLVGVDEATDLAASFPYTGGWTNTGEALETCRTLLASGGEGSSSNGAEQTILLITDGTPTRPDRDSSGAPYTEATNYATEQASAAKGEGTTVITLFVNTATGTSSYLESLASPGFYLEAEDFDELENVSDSLLDLVQCS